MIDVRDIYSLSDFQRNTRQHIERLRRTGRPDVLTVNGKAELIVQDAEAYQRRFVDAQTGKSQLCRRQPTFDPADPAASDPVVEAFKQHVDRSLLRENLSRSVGERLDGLRALQRLAAEAKRAGARTRGRGGSASGGST